MSLVFICYILPRHVETKMLGVVLFGVWKVNSLNILSKFHQMLITKFIPNRKVLLFFCYKQ